MKSSINTMKIDEVNEHTIEEDFHIVTGLFTELPLAKSTLPLGNVELVIIREMSLHDGQFFPTGYTYVKELEIDEGAKQVWSNWLEIYNSPF